MQISNLTLLSLLGTVANVVAQVDNSTDSDYASTTTYTQSDCLTWRGFIPPLVVPTATFSETITLNPIVYITSTPVNTIVPPSVTDLSTITETDTLTLPPNTDTITLVNTTTETDTITTSGVISILTTITAAAVTQQSTTTVAAPSGFIYPSPGVKGSSKRDSKASADTTSLSYFEHRAVKKSSAWHWDATGYQRTLWGGTKYDEYVICTYVVEVIQPIYSTITASSALIITAPPSTISDVTTTTTTITTQDEDVTVTFSSASTETELVTTTLFSTTTISLTVTPTVLLPSATYYAACGPQNLLSTDPSGTPLGLVQAVAPSNPISYKFTNAYDCCVSCITGTFCAGFNFYTADKSCQTNIYNMCPAGQVQVGEKYTSSTQFEATVGNGLCGQVQYVNS